MILALSAATFAVGTQTYAFSGLLPELSAELGVTVGVAGYLATGLAFTFALAAPFVALRTGTFERRRLMAAGLMGLAILNLFAALVSSFESLMGLRILAGLAATVVNPVAPAIVVVLVPEVGRASALAKVQSGIVLSFLLGVPAGSAIGHALGWRSTYLFSAIVCLFAALLIRAWLPRVPSGDTGSWSALKLGWTPSVRKLLGVTLAAFTATFCISPYIAPVMELAVGSSGNVAFIQVLLGAGAIAGLTVAGRVGSRVSVGWMVTGAFALVSMTQVAYSILLMSPLPHDVFSWIGLGTAVFVGASALFSLVPTVQAQLVEAAPSARQVVLALNGSMLFLGQGLGAALGGYVAEVWGLEFMGIAGLLVALGGLGLGWSFQLSRIGYEPPKLV